MEVLYTKRGKKLLVHEGYLYTKHKNLKGSVLRFQCVNRPCHGSLLVNEANEIVRAARDHTCGAPDHGKVAAYRVQNEVRAQAASGQTTHRILLKAAEVISEAESALTHLPDAENFKRFIRRQKARQANSNNAPAPETRTREAEEHLMLQVKVEETLVRNLKAEKSPDIGAEKLPLLQDDIEETVRNLKTEKLSHGVDNISSANADFEIPDWCRITSKGDPFLRGDVTVDGQRMLLFASSVGLEMLRNATHWYADGTYNTAPYLLYQVYTIHAQLDDKTVPCVYCVLAGQSEALYTHILEELKEAEPALEPQVITMDFDSDAFNAFRATFPQADVAFCHVHMSKAIYRKVCQLGLQIEYSEGGAVYEGARMLMALAFLPPEDVCAAMDDLMDHHLVDRLRPLADYVEDTYVGKRLPHGYRGEPLFSPESWSVYQRVLDSEARMNNSSEAYHQKLLSSVKEGHPSLWEFVQTVQREEAVTRLELEQLGLLTDTHDSGLEGPSQKKARYSRAQVNNEYTVREYHAANKLQYLRLMSHIVMA